MAGSTDAIELSSDVGGIISKAAPLLGSILASPLAGVAYSLIASAFGLSSPNVNEITHALVSDPEASIKLKELEYNHAETLEKVAAQVYVTEVEDRKNARGNAILYKDFLRHMAYLVTIGFFGALVFLFLPIPLGENEHDLILVLIGMLASKWATIMDFFYGSSSQHQNLGNLKDKNKNN